MQQNFCCYTSESLFSDKISPDTQNTKNTVLRLKTTLKRYFNLYIFFKIWAMMSTVQLFPSIQKGAGIFTKIRSIPLSSIAFRTKGLLKKMKYKNKRIRNVRIPTLFCSHLRIPISNTILEMLNNHFNSFLGINHVNT